MNKKLAICVPYRNRKKHLNIFIPYITNFLSEKGIEHKIFICHQTDNKPFNRGKTLNIAFMIAREEGYDYFAFHDIDLLPEDNSCDYSYPGQYPIHLAARQSEYDYNLQYPEYFGGCVLFTREQFEAINGYYNDYWGWGWEDEDLFFRTKRKGLANVQYLSNNMINKSVLNINGKNSYITIEKSNIDKNIDKNGFSLMIFIKPEVNAEEYLASSKYSFFQVPIFSAGKKNIITYSKFEEYTANLGFGNSIYSRGLKNEWSFLFLTVDKIKREIRFFINGIEASGIGTKSPCIFKNQLKKLNGCPIIIGNKKYFSLGNIIKENFKGQIGEICLWDKVFQEKEILNQISNVKYKLHKEKLALWYDFEHINNDFIYDKSKYNNHGKLINCYITKQHIGDIKKYSLPYRRNGKFYCLPHKNTGFKELFIIGHIVKYLVKQSDISAQNEKILKLKVEKGKINPDQYGINNLKYKLINKENISKNHTMINVEC